MLVVFAVATILGFTVIPAIPVEAQGSAALSIPPRKNYTLDPGKSVADTLLVRNLDTERTLHLAARIVDFTYNDDTGTPKLMLDQDAPETPWSLKRHIELPEKVDIEPGESASIDMKVSVPEDYKAGSYYSAIILSSSSSDGGNVGLSASGVSLVFVSIPGEVQESLTLEELGVYNVGVENRDGTKGRYQFFNLKMPVRMGYTVRNDGNVAESPVGSISLRNIFGFGDEIMINDMNPNKSLALIGQKRTFTVCVKQQQQEIDFQGTRQEAAACSNDTQFWPGIYRVELNGYYGWNGNATQEIIGKTWMIYAPWWALLILFVALVFIGFYARKAVRFIRGGKSGGGQSSGKRFVARSRK